MNTKDILDIAVDLAGLDYIPADSGVIYEKDNVKRILTGIDISEEEVLLAL